MFTISASGSDTGNIGMNGCLQTYHPQMHRLHYSGQIISNDFCYTTASDVPGSPVSTSWFLCFGWLIKTLGNNLIAFYGKGGCK